jgi:membrane fusion protein (multidrug efflux system)
MAETAAPTPPPRAGTDLGGARRRRSRRFAIFGLVLVAAFVLGGGYWWTTRNDESTDDAFIDSDVLTISSRVDGPVVNVAFVANQWVAKGQVLAEIDPTDFKVAVDAAQANLAVAEAQEQAAESDLALTKTTAAAAIEEAKNELFQMQHEVAVARDQVDMSAADAERAGSDQKRYEDLVKTSDASRQRYEQALADARASAAKVRSARGSVSATEMQVAQAKARLDDAQAAPQRIAMKEAALANANAQVAQARAALRQAELNLSYTKVVAPVDGRVTKRAVELGDVIQHGQAITNLVPDPPWVVANFKETQLVRMRPGQPVTVRVDSLPDLRLKGHVDSVQPGTGSRFALLPAENATGNYVKVVQRVPVKILLDDVPSEIMHRLGPGMSVVPTVDVGAAGTANAATATK